MQHHDSIPPIVAENAISGTRKKQRKENRKVKNYIHTHRNNRVGTQERVLVSRKHRNATHRRQTQHKGPGPTACPRPCAKTGDRVKAKR